MAYASWSVVAGEQPSAAKWNILGTNDAFFEDFIIGTNGVHAAWTSFTPTFANLTVGNGTLTSKYIKYGTMVIGTVAFTLGSTSAVSTSPTFTLPVTAFGTGTYPTDSLTFFPIGHLVIHDISAAIFQGMVTMSSTTTAGFIVGEASSTYVRSTGLTSAVPMTWTTGDKLFANFVYQAAS